jgi:D-arabinose 1-dehydrogenase-like Zn-dependent alcohol dehydrogenase
VQTEKVITGSRHSTRAEFMETMEIMARGIVKPVIGMRRHFTGLEDIFQAITDQTLSGRGRSPMTTSISHIGAP